jgi:uncharacterized protein (TIGR02271 family)
MTRTITGLFDDRAEAEAVASHLRSHDGIDPDRITIHGQSATGTGGDTGDRGFWASLRDLFIADEDRQAYAEGIRRGGFVVSAQVEDAMVDHAMDVFEQHGAVDLDSREAEWRSAGWSGYQPDTMGMSGTAGTAGTAGMAGTARMGTTTDGATMGTDDEGTGRPMNDSAALGAASMGGTSAPTVGGATPMAGAGSGMGTTSDAGMTSGRTQGMTGGTAGGMTDGMTSGVSSGMAGGPTPDTTTGAMAGTGGDMDMRSTDQLGGMTNEERIPIVEEQLRVGKRETDRGRVRVRSYIVETPVNETVTLREEHVHVERRPVDQPLSAADDAFRERTIEAVEHGEEAVVSKEARVREELVIRKDVEQRDETISDTVRRTEVEVDDGRTDTADTTGTGTRPSSPTGV